MQTRNLEYYIKEPATLEDAIAEFKAKAARTGYEILGEVKAYWQRTFFGPKDAFVFASARRVRRQDANNSSSNTN